MTSHDDLSDLLADLARHAPAAVDVLDSDRLRTRIHRRRRRRQVTVAGGSIAAAAAIGAATTFALGPDNPGPEPIATPSTQQAFAITCGEAIAFSPAPEAPLKLTVQLPAVIDAERSYMRMLGTARITNVSDEVVTVTAANGPIVGLAQDGVARTGAIVVGSNLNRISPIPLQPGESIVKEVSASLHGCPYEDERVNELPAGHYEVYVEWRGATAPPGPDTPFDIKLYSGPIPIELR